MVKEWPEVDYQSEGEAATGEWRATVPAFNAFSDVYNPELPLSVWAGLVCVCDATGRQSKRSGGGAWFDL